MRWNDGDMLAILREEADKPGTGGGEGGGAGTGAPAEAAVDAKALHAEIERLRSESLEKDNAIRYWHEQAKAAPAGKGEQQSKKDEPANEEDLIEVASSKGVKGVAELLKKQGFVSADEVESRIEQRARQIATENELAARYPDLKDEKSEFFKETAKRYKPLTDAGVPKALAMKLAADQAHLDGVESGKRKTSAQIEAERKQAEKEERESRARAQAGDRSRNRAVEAEEENDNLDDFQKAICAAMEIDEDAYKKRAKEGVRVGGTR